MKTRCQYAKRIVGIDFLVCQKEDTKGFSGVKDYLKAYCPFQEFCGLTKKMENTELSKKCTKTTNRG